jgi:hypothetical protein
MYYLGAKIPSATIFYNESKHNILARPTNPFCSDEIIEHT